MPLLLPPCRDAMLARLSRLLEELLVARGDGRYGTLLAQLARFDLLILDDWGGSP